MEYELEILYDVEDVSVLFPGAEKFYSKENPILYLFTVLACSKPQARIPLKKAKKCNCEPKAMFVSLKDFNELFEIAVRDADEFELIKLAPVGFWFLFFLFFKSYQESLIAFFWKL